MLKISIMSNDLIRRLSNIKIERAEVGEERRVIDHFTTQLKTSGYSRRKCREIVVAGTLGWIRKMMRREESGEGFYRGAASTIRGRMRKKLLDPVNWYKSKQKTEEEQKLEKDTPRERKRKRKEDDEGPKEATKRKKGEEPTAVMFCPYTHGSELAKKLREAEEYMEKMSGYKLKIVEEGGEKIKDILHGSNPWKGEDCGREGCWLCRTKQMTDKNKKQDCTKRSCVYETWCETCLRKEIEEIDEEEIDDKEKEEKKRKIKVYDLCMSEVLSI